MKNKKIIFIIISIICIVAFSIYKLSNYTIKVTESAIPPTSYNIKLNKINRKLSVYVSSGTSIIGEEATEENYNITVTDE